MRIREGKGIQITGNIAQDGVDKAFQGTEALFLRQLHSLIAGGRRRDGIHILQLIDAETEDPTQDRLHFAYLDRRKLANDIIYRYHTLQRPFTNTGNKAAVLFSQVLVFVQGAAYGKVAVSPIFCYFQQDSQDNFPRSYVVRIHTTGSSFNRHSCRQKESKGAATAKLMPQHPPRTSMQQRPEPSSSPSALLAPGCLCFPEYGQHGSKH